MKSILLLDDDRDFRSLLAPALEQRGHHVVHARTGTEADLAVREGGLDLAVVDGLLPDTDGPSWIARLRARGSSLQVVFVSAFWRDLGSFNRLTKDLGVALVLHKPLTPALFAQEIETLLEGHKVAARPEIAAAEQAVRALSAEYARALPAKGQELAEAVRALRLEPGDQARRGEAINLAHRLRGTAGSYGFAEAGEAAGRLEEALQDATGQRARSDGWQAVDAALADLGRTLEREGAPAEAPREDAALASGRLLAVSRSADFLDLAGAVGRQQLYQVLVATSADEALSLSSRQPPDAAFLDLPSEEAARLARELRGMPDGERLGLAFVSGAGGMPDRIAAAHAGASLFLQKPLDVDQLAAATRQLVAAAQAQRPRVLVVDDDDAFARRACAVLERKGISARHLREPARILEVLEEAPPDLVLLDVVMPGLSGFDVCRMLRSSPRWQDLPIVMVTAQPGVQARIGAFQSGADDYLSKPVMDEELLARVQVRVERARLLRERYDKDALTGLLLRRPMVEAVRARLLEAGRHGRSLALAIVDFDEFKAVNDRHGHLAGDAVLSAYGRLLSRRFRAEDLRGRWGGEEFLLAFPGETATTIQGALERLLAEFSQIDFKGDRSEEFRVAFCVGIAGFPEDGAQLEDLVRAADRRLYAAKRSEGSRVFGRG